MPRRGSRADRRGTILLGTGMTIATDALEQPVASRSAALRAQDGEIDLAQKTDALTCSEAPGQRDPLATVYVAMSEAEFQAHAEHGLRQRGYRVWHVRDARLMAAGLPDVIAVREGHLLFLELKREHGGRISEAQREALAVLGTVPGVVVRLVRPSDWPSVLADLDR